MDISCYFFQNSINVPYLVHTVAHCLHPCSSQVGNACMPRRARLGLGWLAWRISRGQQGTLQKKKGGAEPHPSAPPRRPVVAGLAERGDRARRRWRHTASSHRRRRARKIRVTLRLDLLPFIRHHHQTLCCPRCSSAGPSEQLRPLHTVGFPQFFRPTLSC